MRVNEVKLPSRYSCQSRISSGSIGDIYFVRDKLTGDRVALKVLKGINKRAARTLVDEFSALSVLNHPNLVKVLDFGFTGGNKPFFTMELLEGEDLRVFFRNRDNIKYLRDVIYQVLLALRYLHGNGLLHGDIKPENIMITYDKKVKLLDFGLTVRAGRRRKRLSGTPGYIAPEVVGRKVYSESSDLYALGVSLVEVIAGEIGADFRVLKAALINFGVTNASSLAYFISSLASLDPSERFKDTDEALLALGSSLIQDRLRGEVVRLGEVFVGRERELRLADRFIKRKVGRQLLLIEGMRGVGKRALSKKIIRKAQVKGYVVIEMDELSEDGGAIGSLFDLVAQSLSGREARELKKRYMSIVSLYRQGGAFERRHEQSYLVDLYANLAELIVGVASVKSILIVIQNIDRFSMGFVRFINIIANAIEVKSVDRLLLVVTLNIDDPTRDKETMDNLRSHGTCEKVELRPLNVGEVKELIRRTFDRDLFLQDELKVIYERSGGVPLLVNGFIDYLISTGVITNRDGVWRVSAPGEFGLSIPKSLREICAERYRSLGKDEKGLLKVLSLYGRPIKLNRLLEITKVGFEVVNKLAESGIIDFKDGCISFKNPLYSEFVRGLIGGRKRRVIVRQIAEYLEKSHAGEVSLAELYIEAGDVEKAFEYVMHAYRYLTDRNELYGAFEILTKMKRFLLRSKERDKLIVVLDKLAPLEELLGKVDDAVKDYEYIVRYSRDPEVRVNNLIRLGTQVKHGNRSRGYNLYREAYKLASDIGDKSLIALAMAKMSDFKEGTQREKLLLEAEEMVKKEDFDTLNVIYDRLMRYYKYSGNDDLKELYLNKLISISKHVNYHDKILTYCNILSVKLYDSDYNFISNFLNDPTIRNDFSCTHYGKEQLLNYLGALYYIEGNYFKLADTLREAISIEMIRGNYYEAIAFMGNLAIAYKNICNYSAALRAFREIDRLLSRLECDLHRTTNTVSEARLWLVLGKYFKKSYLKVIRTSRRIAESERDLFRLGHYYLVRSDYHYINIRIRRASVDIEKAITFFRKVSSRDDLCEALLKKAIILCELGEPKRAGVCIKKAWEIYGEIHCEYLKPQLYLARGMVERMNGTDEAIGSLREGLRVSKRQMTREQTWQIQREIALYYRGRRHLKRAIKYYRDAVETIKQITETIPTEEIKVSYLEVPLRKRVFEEIRELKREVGG